MDMYKKYLRPKSAVTTSSPQAQAPGVRHQGYSSPGVPDPMGRWASRPPPSPPVYTPHLYLGHVPYSTTPTETQPPDNEAARPASGRYGSHTAARAEVVPTYVTSPTARRRLVSAPMPKSKPLVRPQSALISARPQSAAVMQRVNRRGEAMQQSSREGTGGGSGGKPARNTSRPPDSAIRDLFKEEPVPLFAVTLSRAPRQKPQRRVVSASDTRRIAASRAHLKPKELQECLVEYSHMDAHMAAHSQRRASSARPAAAKQSTMLLPERSDRSLNGEMTFSEAFASLQEEVGAALQVIEHRAAARKSPARNIRFNPAFSDFLGADTLEEALAVAGAPPRSARSQRYTDEGGLKSHHDAYAGVAVGRQSTRPQSAFAGKRSTSVERGAPATGGSTSSRPPRAESAGRVRGGSSAKRSAAATTNPSASAVARPPSARPCSARAPTDRSRSSSPYTQEGTVLPKGQHKPRASALSRANSSKTTKSAAAPQSPSSRSRPSSPGKKGKAKSTEEAKQAWAEALKKLSEDRAKVREANRNMIAARDERETARVAMEQELEEQCQEMRDAERLRKEQSYGSAQGLSAEASGTSSKMQSRRSAVAIPVVDRAALSPPTSFHDVVPARGSLPSRRGSSVSQTKTSSKRPASARTAITNIAEKWQLDSGTSTGAYDAVGNWKMDLEPQTLEALKEVTASQEAGGRSPLGCSGPMSPVRHTWWGGVEEVEAALVAEVAAASN